MNKPRYRYWESTTHPRYRKAWVLVGGCTTAALYATAGFYVPYMLPVKNGETFTPSVVIL